MNAPDLQHVEKKLRKAGSNLPYPPTPQLAAKVMAQLTRPARARFLRGRWAGALIAILILTLTLILVPPARAALLDFIQIGVVRIFSLPPAPRVIGTPAFEAPLTATPVATLLPSVLNLAGETTLSNAQSKVDFTILLPTYPPDLGQPDHVYLQYAGSPMLVLVWMEPDRPDKVRLSLDEIAQGSWTLEKFEPRIIQETTVNGQHAVWAEGPYMLQITNQNYELKRLVGGRVLIWTQDNITYRLETDLSLDEAIKIAESLKPVSSPTPTSSRMDVPSAATSISHETFVLTGEQAQEIAVFMNFIHAYNNGQLDEALALLADNVGTSDCDYRNVRVVTFQGKSQVLGWLQQRISDHDRLEVSRIDNENPDPVSGRHVIGVTYSRRTNLTLAKLGFGDGIVPKLASKVSFTPEPTLIQSLGNGPYGGDPEFCRPGG